LRTKIIFFIVLGFILTGCASSSVSRGAADEVDTAYDNTHSFVTQPGMHPAESFQNASQTARGAVVGGAAGAVVGGVAYGTVGLMTGAAGGAVLGGVLGAYIDQHTDIVDRLENRGVKVFILGDQVRIVMPSAWTFKAMTPDIRPEAYSSLDLIAQLIRGFTTMSVKIAAYTNNTGDPRVNCVVSQAQANAIMRYLWPRVNTRVLSAAGYGGTHLIARNNPNWDEGANYRVEITLEKLPT
jgi:outer membrane protein OmpA-like peptidoglycan-associated protein